MKTLRPYHALSVRALVLGTALLMTGCSQWSMSNAKSAMVERSCPIQTTLSLRDDTCQMRAWNRWLEEHRGQDSHERAAEVSTLPKTLVGQVQRIALLSQPGASSAQANQVRTLMTSVSDQMPPTLRGWLTMQLEWHATLEHLQARHANTLDQIQDLQRQRDQLEEKLQALTDIERSINLRKQEVRQ